MLSKILHQTILINLQIIKDNRPDKSRTCVGQHFLSIS